MNRASYNKPHVSLGNRRAATPEVQKQIKTITNRLNRASTVTDPVEMRLELSTAYRRLKLLNQSLISQ